MPGQAVVTINDKQWTVEIATTLTELVGGLAGRTSLAPNTGMLFVLPMAQQMTVTTENMLFPIDIIFIANNTVISVASNTQPGLLVTEETPGDMFLEVNAGEAAGVQAGDSVYISRQIQPMFWDTVGMIALATVIVVPIVALLGKGVLYGKD